MLDVSRVDGGSVVHLVGELDLGAVPSLRGMLADVIDARTSDDLILDLGGITFMDSSGLNTILWACREIGPGRRVRLRQADRMVRKLLEMTGVLAIGNLVLEQDSAPVLRAGL